MKFTVLTSKKREIVDITDEVEGILFGQKNSKGVCNVHVIHTTASITTADLDPGTDQDFLDAIEKIVPRLKYRHPHDASHTPDHIASSLVGTSVSIPFNDKKLILGIWQRLILVEFNGPKERHIFTAITT